LKHTWKEETKAAQSLEFRLPPGLAGRFSAVLELARQQLTAAARGTASSDNELVAVTIARELTKRSQAIPDWLAVTLLIERFTDRCEASTGELVGPDRNDGHDEVRDETETE
jgi:hypothetical protein